VATDSWYQRVTCAVAILATVGSKSPHSHLTKAVAATIIARMDTSGQSDTGILFGGWVHFVLPYFTLPLGILATWIIELSYSPAGQQHIISGSVIETPLYVPEILAGLLAGWFLFEVWPSRTALLAWALPLAFLVWSASSWHETMAMWDSTWDTYFGRNCGGSECLYQVFLTVPFYASTAYSIGAFMRFRTRAGNAVDSAADGIPR